VLGESLALLCVLLFVDGATLSLFTTPLVLQYGKLHNPWLVGALGGAASALGAAVQIVVVRWALDSKLPLLQRLAPTRERLEAALKAYPSASFLAILLARATPLPDAPLKIVAAAVHYPVWRYALAVFLGTLPYFVALSLVGRALKIPAWVLVAAAAAILAGFLVDRLRRRRTGPA
jgi:uncharacterized membrane protein YdjX (TVP38/TMEM64 family)